MKQLGKFFLLASIPLFIFFGLLAYVTHGSLQNSAERLDGMYEEVQGYQQKNVSVPSALKRDYNYQVSLYHTKQTRLYSFWLPWVMDLPTHEPIE